MAGRTHILAAGLLLLIATGPAAAAADDGPADYAGPGACAADAAATRVPLRLPPESGCGRDCALTLHLVGPAPGAPAAWTGSRRGAASAAADAPDPGAGCAPPPRGWPLVFLYPGFQLRAGFYDNYASRLASWGWVVVRYDLELLDLVPAAVEVRGWVGGGAGFGGGGRWGLAHARAPRWKCALPYPALGAEL
jgi:hypothetical protein